MNTWIHASILWTDSALRRVDYFRECVPNARVFLDGHGGDIPEGQGASWNHCARAAFARTHDAGIVLVHIDAYPDEAYLDGFVQEAQAAGAGLALARRENFACIYITREAYKTIGPFDANFYPASPLIGCDYLARAKRAGVRVAWCGSPSGFLHVHCSSLQHEGYRRAYAHFAHANREYWRMKWGVYPGMLLYKIPFQGEDHCRALAARMKALQKKILDSSASAEHFRNQ